MSDYVMVQVKCPICKKDIAQVQSNKESDSSTKHTKTCPGCKKAVTYVVKAGEVTF